MKYPTAVVVAILCAGVGMIIGGVMPRTRASLERERVVPAQVAVRVDAAEFWKADGAYATGDGAYRDAARMVPASLADRLTEAHFAKIPGYESMVSREVVLQNSKDRIERLLAVLADVWVVQVSCTSDTGTPVIHLRSTDGREASIWLEADGTVNAITPY